MSVFSAAALVVQPAAAAWTARDAFYAEWTALASLAQQEPVVGGIVLEARTLRPIAGAQVVVDGTEIGTVTDGRGAFRLGGLPSGQVTLRVVMIGYDTVVRDVRVGETDVRLELRRAVIELDEVIVTGTVGGQQRRSLGNSVATVAAAEALDRSGAQSVATLLNARAPGVTITPGSGRVGSGPTIQIRGRSTISLDSDPIIYIDGVRLHNAVNTGPPAGGLGAQGARTASRLGDINPEDIESIEVNKGPAAATIYGTEAANGVIQIITKKGALGGARWTGRVEQGAMTFRDAENRVPTNYYRNEAGAVETWNGIRQEKERGTPVYGTGHLQSYNLAVAGGQDLLRYYVSGTLDDTEGLEPNNWGRRFSGHASLNVAASDRLDVATSLHLVRSSMHLGADVGLSSLWTSIFGSPAFFPDSRGFWVVPPEVPQSLYDNPQDINRYTGGVTLNHRPVSWFSHR
ncbi:MAG: TonB-dependent receptor plug domain-containing protein, partial [Longimicrobiales bacterium]